MSKKTILITGVTRGLGRAMTEAFIAEGHNVIGGGRSEPQIAALASQYPSQQFSVVDLADFNSVKHWCSRIKDIGLVPDILVNNAGIINANAPLWEVPVNEFSAVIDVNVKGVYHVIQQFCPLMIENGGGVIVNFSSGWGRGVNSDVAPYCASKWAIEGLSKALAEDLPRSMASVALNPGIIHTEMLESCFGDQAKSFSKPDEWAKNAVPMILGLSASDNGASLTVN